MLTKMCFKFITLILMIVLIITPIMPVNNYADTLPVEPGELDVLDLWIKVIEKNRRAGSGIDELTVIYEGNCELSASFPYHYQPGETVVEYGQTGLTEYNISTTLFGQGYIENYGEWEYSMSDSPLVNELYVNAEVFQVDKDAPLHIEFVRIIGGKAFNISGKYREYDGGPILNISKTDTSQMYWHDPIDAMATYNSLVEDTGGSDRYKNIPEGDLIWDGDKYVSSGKYTATYTDPIFGSNDSIEIYYRVEKKEFSIKDILPCQTMARYSYIDEYHYERANLLVSDKDTSIVVLLPICFKASDVRSKVELVVKNDYGSFTLTDGEVDNKNNAIIFGQNQSNDWKEGNYTFEAKVGGTVKLESDNWKFQKQSKLKIYAVPVIARYGNDIRAPGNDWLNADSFIRKIYPIAYQDIQFVRVENPVDLSDLKYDLNTESGSIACLNELHNRFGSGNDVVAGFIDVPINGNILGRSLTGSKAVLVSNLPGSESSPLKDVILAHEVAHVFYAGDEYQGGSFNLIANRPPYGNTGTYIYDQNIIVTATDSSVKQFPGGTGSLIEEKLLPFDAEKGSLLEDKQSLMAGSGPRDSLWISPDLWKYLFYKLSIPPVASNVTLQSEISGYQVINVTGRINKAGEVQFSLPWFAYGETDLQGPSNGQYTIQAVNETGSVLASNGFTPSYTHLTDPTTVVDYTPFSVSIPLIKGTKLFRILDEYNNILAESSMSTNAPTITINTPTDRSDIKGTLSITWNAEDPDGEELFYKVDYSCDGINWDNLAYMITDNTLEVDISYLKGGDQAQIRVTVSDGINNTIAYSGKFNIPLKESIDIRIENPIDQTSYSKDVSVILYGSAYDFQEEQIFDDNRLIWTSDRDGEIGRGHIVCAKNFSVGQHKISLTAINSNGFIAEKSIVLNITPTLEINVSQNSININVGESQLLSPIVNLSNTKTLFISDNPFIATVDQQTGLVTAIAAGETSITAITSKEGYYSKAINIMVNVMEMSPAHNIVVASNNEAMGTSIGSGTYNEGSIVTVTASANEGYNFVNWTEEDTVVSIDAVYGFTLGTSDRSLVANFEPISVASHTVTVSSSNEAMGTASGSGIYNEGSIVKVTASANEGYSFVNWTEGDTVVSTESLYEFALGKADHNLVANFTPNIPVIKSVTGNPTSWQSEDVTLTINAYDSGSGLPVTGAYSFDDGVSWQDENYQVFDQNGLVRIKVRDTVGNISESTEVLIDKIDKMQPSVTISGVSYNDDATINLGYISKNYLKTVNYEALDDLSGIAPEGALTTSGIFNIATKNAGFELSQLDQVFDLAGNTTNITFEYNVLALEEIAKLMQPVTDSLKIFKAGRTIPIKLQIIKNGVAQSISAEDITFTLNGTQAPTSKLTNIPEATFRLSDDGITYIYNLNTKKWLPGTYTFDVLLSGSGSIGSFTFALIK